MSTIIQDIESSQLRSDLPDFAPGDRVRVHFLVIEGNRKRPQVFEGVVIKRQGSGARETFTVRKQSFGVGVERTFPLHSPKIEKLEVASRGRVRRAKLYYLRGRTGKAARVAERRWGIDEDVVAAGATGAVDASGEGLAPEEVPEPETVEAEVGENGEESVTEGGDGKPEADASDAPVEDSGTPPDSSDEAEAPAEESDSPAEETSAEAAEGEAGDQSEASPEDPGEDAVESDSDPEQSGEEAGEDGDQA